MRRLMHNGMGRFHGLGAVRAVSPLDNLYAIVIVMRVNRSLTLWASAGDT